MYKTIDLPIGTRFYFKEKLYEVVESSSEHCQECYRFLEGDWCTSGFICDPRYRHDGKRVYFKWIPEIEERSMKLNESDVVDGERNGVNVKESKKTVYRGLDIYAVKRSTDYSDVQCTSLDITNRAWWCGYVEVPTAMYSSFKPMGYLDDEILYRLADPYSYNLEVVHGGYTYMDYGIPLVLDDNQRIFIGWDYSHSEDTESCVTYDEIINVGKKVIDSMFKKIGENNNE